MFGDAGAAVHDADIQLFRIQTDPDFNLPSAHFLLGIDSVAEQIADYLHGLGREFGATTGRPRRCGWTDGVVLRFSAMFNGFDEMAMTNLDGLDERDTIKICTAYKMGDQILEYPPARIEDWAL